MLNGDGFPQYLCTLCQFPLQIISVAKRGSCLRPSSSPTCQRLRSPRPIIIPLTSCEDIYTLTLTAQAKYPFTCLPLSTSSLSKLQHHRKSSPPTVRLSQAQHDRAIQNKIHLYNSPKTTLPYIYLSYIYSLHILFIHAPLRKAFHV